MKKLDIEPTRRISTRTRVKGKKLIPIEVIKIRPTGPMDWSIKRIVDSPICLIRDPEEDYYYIADGNHRFFTKLLVQKIELINAWVLEEGDQRRIHGNPLSTMLQDWKDGFISLKNLFYKAREAYEINIKIIKADLEECGGRFINSDPVNNSDGVTNLADFLHLGDSKPRRNDSVAGGNAFFPSVKSILKDKMKNSILIVDHEVRVRESLKMILQKDYKVLLAKNAEEAFFQIKNNPPGVILLDAILPDMDSLGALSRIKCQYPDTIVIIITAKKSVQTAVKAIKRGAFDYVFKPFDIDKLLSVISRSFSKLAGV